MRCERAEPTLTLLAEGVEVEPDDATRHISRCLRCQAALAQHRRVRRTMRSLRARTVEPAPSLLADILAVVEGGEDVAAAGGRWRGRRLLVVAAATAVTAAGATGAVVWSARGRRTAAG